MNHPYDPRRYKRSNRTIIGGRLRPLPDVLLSRQLRQMRGKQTKCRPLGWHDWWPSVARNTISQNGHQLRRRQRLMAAFKQRLASSLQRARALRSRGFPGQARA